MSDMWHMNMRHVHMAAEMSHPAQQRDEAQHQPRKKADQIKRLPVHRYAPIYLLRVFARDPESLRP
jgi:hypothetical protein